MDEAKVEIACEAVAELRRRGEDDTDALVREAISAYEAAEQPATQAPVPSVDELSRKLSGPWTSCEARANWVLSLLTKHASAAPVQEPPFLTRDDVEEIDAIFENGTYDEQRWAEQANKLLRAKRSPEPVQAVSRTEPMDAAREAELRQKPAHYCVHEVFPVLDTTRAQLDAANKRAESDRALLLELQEHLAKARNDVTDYSNLSGRDNRRAQDAENVSFDLREELHREGMRLAAEREGHEKTRAELQRVRSEWLRSPTRMDYDSGQKALVYEYNRAERAEAQLQSDREDDKAAEAAYCIEGDYTGEDVPVRMALARLHASNTMVARQRDEIRGQLQALGEAVEPIARIAPGASVDIAEIDHAVLRLHVALANVPWEQQLMPGSWYTEPSEVAKPREVSTDKLSPAEIRIADAQGRLRVDVDGLGFVTPPKQACDHDWGALDHTDLGVPMTEWECWKCGATKPMEDDGQPATQAPVPTRESIADELASHAGWELSDTQAQSIAFWTHGLLTKHASAPVQGPTTFEVTPELVRLLLEHICYDDGQIRNSEQVARGLRVVFGEALSSAANGIGAGNWHARAVRAERELAKRSPEPAQAVTITREHANAVYAEWYRGQKVWDGGCSAEMAMHSALANVFGSSAVQVPTFDRDALLAKINALSAEVTAAGGRIADRIDNEVVNPLRAQLDAANKLVEHWKRHGEVADERVAELEEKLTDDEGNDWTEYKRLLEAANKRVAAAEAELAVFGRGIVKETESQLAAEREAHEKTRAELVQRKKQALEDHYAMGKYSGRAMESEERAERAEAQLASLREAVAGVVTSLSDHRIRHGNEPDALSTRRVLEIALNAPPQQPAEACAHDFGASDNTDLGVPMTEWECWKCGTTKPMEDDEQPVTQVPVPTRAPKAQQPTESPNTLGEALDKAHEAFADEPEWSEVAKPEAPAPQRELREQTSAALTSLFVLVCAMDGVPARQPLRDECVRRIELLEGKATP